MALSKEIYNVCLTRSSSSDCEVLVLLGYAESRRKMLSERINTAVQTSYKGLKLKKLALNQLDQTHAKIGLDVLKTAFNSNSCQVQIIYYAKSSQAKQDALLLSALASLKEKASLYQLNLLIDPGMFHLSKTQAQLRKSGLNARAVSQKLDDHVLLQLSSFIADIWAFQNRPAAALLKPALDTQASFCRQLEIQNGNELYLKAVCSSEIYNLLNQIHVPAEIKDMWIKKGIGKDDLQKILELQKQGISREVIESLNPSSIQKKYELLKQTESVPKVFFENVDEREWINSFHKLHQMSKEFLKQNTAGAALKVCSILVQMQQALKETAESQADYAQILKRMLPDLRLPRLEVYLSQSKDQSIQSVTGFQNEMFIALNSKEDFYGGFDFEEGDESEIRFRKEFQNQFKNQFNDQNEENGRPCSFSEAEFAHQVLNTPSSKQTFDDLQSKKSLMSRKKSAAAQLKKQSLQTDQKPASQNLRLASIRPAVKSYYGSSLEQSMNACVEWLDNLPFPVYVHLENELLRSFRKELLNRNLFIPHGAEPDLPEFDELSGKLDLTGRKNPADNENTLDIQDSTRNKETGRNKEEAVKDITAKKRGATEKEKAADHAVSEDRLLSIPITWILDHPSVFFCLNESLEEGRQNNWKNSKTGQETVNTGKAGKVQKPKKKAKTKTKNDSVGSRFKAGEAEKPVGFKPVKNQKFISIPKARSSLSEEQITVLTDPDFSVGMVRRLALAFYQGMDFEVVEKLAELPDQEMKIRRMNDYSLSYLYPTCSQRLLKEFLSAPKEQFDLLANPALSYAKREEIARALEEGWSAGQIRNRITAAMPLNRIQEILSAQAPQNSRDLWDFPAKSSGISDTEEIFNQNFMKGCLNQWISAYINNGLSLEESLAKSNCLLILLQKMAVIL